MDAGKEAEFLERRKKAAKDVKLVEVGPNRFNVVDESGNFKYAVCTELDHEDCTCPNFVQCNTKKYWDAHGELYLCKHVLAGQYYQILQQRCKEVKTHTEELTH